MPTVPTRVVDGHEPARVRTYAARRGRLSALTRERLDRFGPQRSLPAGPLDQHVAFGRVAPLVLEVGCGHGAAAIAYAAAHPEHDVVAVDVHTPGIARMLAAADRARVPNLRIELGDGVSLLEHHCRAAQLTAMHLFFPDPWPKQRHAKRRFVSTHTLDLLADRLTADGVVLMATDQPAYAAHVVAEVARHGAFVAHEASRPQWRPVDGFERMALAVGRSIVDLRLERQRS